MPEHESFDPEGTYRSLTSDDWKAFAKQLGLPEDSTKAQILKARRKAQALELGLPEDATQAAIYAFKERRARKALARQYGLPETARHAEIERAATTIGAEQLRQKGIRDFGLPEGATLHDISVAMVKRLREQHKTD